MISCTKRLDNFPFAHRQPNHKGHCSLIHGHNWSFEFEFVTKELDANGFVIDFGDLGWLKAFLTSYFDHTLVLNEDDPHLEHLNSHLTGRFVSVLARIITVPNCGAEGLAMFVFNKVNIMLQDITHDRVFLRRVTVFEDTKNSATFVG